MEISPDTPRESVVRLEIEEPSSPAEPDREIGEDSAGEDSPGEGDVLLDIKKPSSYAEPGRKIGDDSAGEDEVFLDIKEPSSAHVEPDEEINDNTPGGSDGNSRVITEESSPQAEPNKKVDYVLVYERFPDNEVEDDKTRKTARDKDDQKRKTFERNLKTAGLEIIGGKETAAPTDVEGELKKWYERCLKHCGRERPREPETRLHFVLLHAPWPVLEKRADEMRLKVPFQENDIISKSWIEKKVGEERMTSLRRRIGNPLVVKDPTLDEKPKYFMADFRKDRITMFSNHQNRETFFENADRAYIVQQICYSARFNDDANDAPLDVGLKRMILDGVYQAGYSPHDGSVLPEADGKINNDRQRLKRDWARFGRSFKYQPYAAIKDYFGSEIALYFAWLGFYTKMLVPLAIVGLAVFFYGIGSAGSHIPVKDVCDEKNHGVWYMCPLCDKHCSYWDLASTTCVYAYVTHFFDNDGTVFLALVASIWGTLFLEFWKRRQATLAQEWHTDDLEKGEDTLRPEYSYKVRNAPKKMNIVTGQMEPHVPKFKMYFRYGGVVSIILFMITLVIAAVVGVIVYRVAVFASLSGSPSSRIVTSATAGALNLVAINLLKFAYSKLAVWLTDWENPPTRTDYEYSFTWKMYTFQFVNTYASIFYIAFFKSGHVIGTPSRYKRLVGEFRLDGCSEQGCLLDLCVQLLFIMVGQQIIRNVMEIGLPFFLYWIKNRNKPEDSRPQYEREYELSPHKDHYMFWEYLDVVLQFGFATMFVAAFPLGPFFALLTSIIQIRVDAINFVSQFRRPDSTRAQDIGAWLRILEIVTKMSILVNAFVLAFTSEFIPKFLYKMKYAPGHDSPGGGSLTGYIDNSLASINISYIFHKEPGTEPKSIQENFNKVCRYPGYHEPVWPYEVSKQYWEVIAARLAFVFVFQFTVYLVTSFISWLVPSVPKDLKLKTLREKHLFKEKLSKLN